MRRLLTVFTLVMMVMLLSTPVVGHHKDGHDKGPGHKTEADDKNKGNSPSRPDQDGIGADHGVDNDDKVEDGNNGCGNDSDREDDNNGKCGKPEVSPTARPTVAPTPPLFITVSPSPTETATPDATPSATPTDTDDASPAVKPTPPPGEASFPLTGTEVVLWVAFGLLLAAAGALLAGFRSE